MKKSELVSLVSKSGITVGSKASLKEIREKLIAFYSAPTYPTEEEIGRMKKDELRALIDKAGINSQKDLKSMQSALISHYRSVSA